MKVLKNGKLGLVLGVFAFLNACAPSAEKKAMEFEESYDVNQYEVDLSLPIDSVSYAYGAVIQKRAFSQSGGNLNAMTFLNSFHQGLNNSGLDLQKLSDDLYQLRRQNQGAPDYVNQFSEKLGLYMGSMDQVNPLVRKMTMSSLSKGFNDGMNQSVPSNLNADSLYREASEQFNKGMGEAFLAQNKQKEGVQVTASGLQYRVLKETEGDKPTEKNEVTVHYTGKLISGTVFDSSVQRGQPISFNLGGVIAGWTEGLQLMSVGSKYRFYIPQELAYGSRGMSKIPPYSTLVFDVELFSFK